jgi:hypothetical protein
MCDGRASRWAITIENRVTATPRRFRLAAFVRAYVRRFFSVRPTDMPFTCTVPNRGKQPIREDRLRTRRFSAGPLDGTVSGATASWAALEKQACAPCLND